MVGKKVVAGLLLVGLVLSDLSGQPASRPASATAPVRLIQVDRTRRQVVIEASVCLQQGLLEFLLCKQGTKDYESLLATKASPSSLHAALLALGLMPGKPAQWTTPPGQEPVFVPPQGALLDIALRWVDQKGTPHEAPATDWMLTAGTKKPAPATRWVFVGSDFLEDGQYWADVEGQFVSVANFASTVIDVPFRSSDKNALLEFVADSRVVPPKATPVQVVITAVKGAETAPVARISLTVDHLGRIEMDGRPMSPEDVAAAAKQFLSLHAQGAADVRLSGRALVFDQERLRDILQEAGLTDVSFRRLTGGEEVLPRTAAQAAKSIAWWKQQFAQAKDLLTDPGEDAAAALAGIQRQRKELQALAELWADYADQVSALAAEYRARRQQTTAPATGPSQP
jgi:hypothetical protein